MDVIGARREAFRGSTLGGRLPRRPPERRSIALVLGLAIAAATLASCDGPAAYANGLVQVANLSQTDASFHWQSPGLLGTPLLGGSGTEPIRACETYARGFDPGDQRITIASASDTVSFVLAAPSNGQTVVWYVIGADGSIAKTTEAAAPASPHCAP